MSEAPETQVNELRMTAGEQSHVGNARQVNPVAIGTAETLVVNDHQVSLSLPQAAKKVLLVSLRAVGTNEKQTRESVEIFLQ